MAGKKAQKPKDRTQRIGRITSTQWVDMTGRQRTQLREQAETYGIPIWGPWIDLYKAVPSLFTVIGKLARGRSLTRVLEDEDPNDPTALSVGPSPALEQYRAAKARLAELELATKQGQMLEVEAVRPTLWKFAALMRDAGEKLQQRFGREAREVLDQAIDAAEDEITRHFGGDCSDQD